MSLSQHQISSPRNFENTSEKKKKKSGSQAPLAVSLSLSLSYFICFVFPDLVKRIGIVK
jgi:hypothetical protein